jgi:ABC-type histidine transport system ATPase subunit
MTKPLIVAKNIKKSFVDTGEVLKGISFDINIGDIVAILGASGSGKSTLLRCLNLLEIPDSGDLIINNEKIEFITKHNLKTVDEKKLIELRKNISMVFQHFNLWTHMNVLQNITEPLVRVLKIDKNKAIEKAHNCLDKVGLTGYDEKFPSQISGGQKQRVAIARALAIDPKIILFDEPTSALDPELVQEVLNIMSKLAKEKTTMVVVTHEISFAENISNKTMFLHEGKIDSFCETSKMFSNNHNSKVFNKFIKQLSS